MKVVGVWMSVDVVEDGAFETLWTGVDGRERRSDSHLVFQESDTNNGKRFLHKYRRQETRSPMITPIAAVLNLLRLEDHLQILFLGRVPPFKIVP